MALSLLNLGRSHSREVAGFSRQTGMPIFSQISKTCALKSAKQFPVLTRAWSFRDKPGKPLNKVSDLRGLGPLPSLRRACDQDVKGVPNQTPTTLPVRIAAVTYCWIRLFSRSCSAPCTISMETTVRFPLKDLQRARLRLPEPEKISKKRLLSGASCNQRRWALTVLIWPRRLSTCFGLPWTTIRRPERVCLLVRTAAPTPRFSIAPFSWHPPMPSPDTRLPSRLLHAEPGMCSELVFETQVRGRLPWRADCRCWAGRDTRSRCRPTSASSSATRGSSTAGNSHWESHFRRFPRPLMALRHPLPRTRGTSLLTKTDWSDLGPPCVSTEVWKLRPDEHRDATSAAAKGIHPIAFSTPKSAGLSRLTLGKLLEPELVRAPTSWNPWKHVLPGADLTCAQDRFGNAWLLPWRSSLMPHSPLESTSGLSTKLLLRLNLLRSSPGAWTSSRTRWKPPMLGHRILSGFLKRSSSPGSSYCAHWVGVTTFGGPNFCCLCWALIACFSFAVLSYVPPRGMAVYRFGPLSIHRASDSSQPLVSASFGFSGQHRRKKRHWRAIAKSKSTFLFLEGLSAALSSEATHR